MSVLAYIHHAEIEDLKVGECTIHRASGSGPARWWLLWFNVLRDNDGQPEIFCVPVNPNGPYLEHGPGGRTWGLTWMGRDDGKGNWQISPSINVLDDRDAVAGTHDHPSVWHQTPEITNVSDDEAWIVNAP